MQAADERGRRPIARAAIDRYLDAARSRAAAIIRWRCCKRAGVDLSRPETVRAVVDQLDTLVTELERAIEKLSV